MLKVARGRIWTGEDAKALGLVDELGGFATALRLAKNAAKIPETEEVHLRVYPEKRGTLELLLERLMNLDTTTQWLRALQPVAARLAPLAAPPAALRMPPLEAGR